MTNTSIVFHNKESIKKIVIRYLVCLIPLIIYGIYKNGFLLYTRDLIFFLSIFKIIYLLIISLIVYIVIDKLLFKKREFWSMDLLFLLIIPLFIPPNINILLYSIVLFVSFFLSNILEKKFKFNKIAFCKLVIIAAIVIFSNYTYQNVAEGMHIYSLNYWDYLWGRYSGGIASTNIIFGIFILLIFSTFKSYKKIIAISSLLAFIILSFLLSGFDSMVFISSSAILGFILLSIDSLSTPHTKRAMLLYGIISGIITSFLTIYVNSNEGVFISTLFLSFFSSTLDKIVERW